MQKSIKNYFDYFAEGPLEKAWGMHVSSIGYTRVRPHHPYPPQVHPDHHHFSWTSGRSLNALQVVWIPKGTGRLEWDGGQGKVEAGMCFLLLPGLWHRYKPDPQTGWTEHWIELKGPQVEEWITKGIIQPERILFRIPSPNFMKQWFHSAHTIAHLRPPGFPLLLNGLALTLLAEALRHATRPNRLTKRTSHLVREAQRRLGKGGESVNEIAKQLGVSYPTLARHFRRETGLSPKAYQDKIRMLHAERLLASTDLEIKEIAALLHFHSAFHFSARFNRTYGTAPSSWRRKRKNITVKQ